MVNGKMKFVPAQVKTVSQARKNVMKNSESEVDRINREYAARQKKNPVTAKDAARMKTTPIRTVSQARNPQVKKPTGYIKPGTVTGALQTLAANAKAAREKKKLREQQANN